MINKIIRFITKHKALDNFFCKFRWYRKLVVKQAFKLITKITALEDTIAYLKIDINGEETNGNTKHL